MYETLEIYLHQNPIVLALFFMCPVASVLAIAAYLSDEIEYFARKTR